MEEVSGHSAAAHRSTSPLRPPSGRRGGDRHRRRGLRVAVRGGSLTLRHLPAGGRHIAGTVKVILASGDGGWRGFDDEMAGTAGVMGLRCVRSEHASVSASLGATRHCLRRRLSEDFGAVAAAVSDAGGARVMLMGWSAGAALVVLAGARTSEQAAVGGGGCGFAAKEGELGWHWSDTLTFLPFVKWRGPFFSCLDYVPQVAPLPLLLIQSSRDRWVPDEDRQELFQVAIRPRRRVLLHGGGHSFPGARAEFFEELRSGFRWMDRQARQ